jgi:pilus assembly protein FimV
LASTESLRAPVSEESFVVVEQESTLHPQPLDDMDETVDALAPEGADADATVFKPAAAEPKEETGTFDSLEDTFSSETAINLDQTDPIAEADFHMAYGLYDQAADLITGALEIEPDRQDLLTKLCEIYFVWGNRDAFVDAAGKLKAAVGDADSEDWNKIVIMGQQIAADDKLFADASAVGATKEVDLAFEADMHETGALDMELIAETEGDADIVDLGAEDGDDDIIDLGIADDDETAAIPAADSDTGVDFFVDSDDETEVVAEEETELAPVDLDETAESPDFDVTREMPAAEETAEMPTAEITVETPTIEQQFDEISGTAELPSLDETLGEAIGDSDQAAEETAEINLDDLGLDVDSFAETELASLEDLDATGEVEALADTGINEEVEDLEDVTGKNPELDPDDTGLQAALSADDTGINEALSETGFNEALDESLLDATGVTQVLSSDLAVDTTTDAEAELGSEDATMLAPGYGDETADAPLEDDQETMLASLDDDEEPDAGDFDFAKTEALPKEAFTGDQSLDETGEMPAVASTDVDLDLDDLTAALKVSEAAGDTVEQPRDDATVEQPRPTMTAEEVDEDGETLSIGPEDMSDDLHDARTMTEVGTKLDLARAYVDMGDPAGARSILEEVLDEGDEAQRQQAQQLLDSLPS